MLMKKVIREPDFIWIWSCPSLTLPPPKRKNKKQANIHKVLITILLTHHCGFQVNKDGSGDVLPSPRLTEERVEGVVVASDRIAIGHLSVWLDVVFQTVELPAGVPHLHPGLAHMDRDTFTLGKIEQKMQLRNCSLCSTWKYSTWWSLFLQNYDCQYVQSINLYFCIALNHIRHFQAI